MRLRESGTSISSLPHLILVCSLVPLPFLCCVRNISSLQPVFHSLPLDMNEESGEGKEKQRPE